jgi:hypothetical protein
MLCVGSIAAKTFLLSSNKNHSRNPKEKSAARPKRMRVWVKTFFSEHPRESKRGTNQGWVLGEERMQDFDAVMNAKKLITS